MEEREKKHPKIEYTDLRFYASEKLHPWAKDFREAFGLLDKDSQFPIIILVSADDYAYKENILTFKGLKRIRIIDKGSCEFDEDKENEGRN